MNVKTKQILKYIYQIIPLKRQFYIATKKLLIPPRSISQYLRFTGVFKFRIDTVHAFLMKSHGFAIESDFFWNGFKGWEETSMKLWMKLSEKANVIFDIGSNLGIYSLVAQCMNPQSTIYAFEPLAGNFVKLMSNVKINNYHVKCQRAALSNNNGIAKIYFNPLENQLSDKASLNQNFLPNASYYEIETLTLKTFIEKNNIPNINLMKIDVETHEPEVLQGFAEYLDKFRPTLLLEILNEEVGKKVESYLKDKNYLYFNICEETGNISQVNHIIKSDSFNYLICSEMTAKEIGVID